MLKGDAKAADVENYVKLMQQYDETWWAYPLWIAAAVEIHLGMVSHSRPVILCNN